MEAVPFLRNFQNLWICRLCHVCFVFWSHGLRIWGNVWNVKIDKISVSEHFFETFPDEEFFLNQFGTERLSATSEILRKKVMKLLLQSNCDPRDFMRFWTRGCCSVPRQLSSRIWKLARRKSCGSKWRCCRRPGTKPSTSKTTKSSRTLAAKLRRYVSESFSPCEHQICLRKPAWWTFVTFHFWRIFPKDFDFWAMELRKCCNVTQIPSAIQRKCLHFSSQACIRKFWSKLRSGNRPKNLDERVRSIFLLRWSFYRYNPSTRQKFLSWTL